MNNLFSKSHETYEKLIQQLDRILTEQRHQRIDLAQIQRDLKIIINASNLQKQVDEYFGDDEEESEQVVSH